MSKATHGLSATIGLCKTYSRRAFMRFGVIATACGVAPAAASAAQPTALTAQPTELGRRALALIAKHKELWANAPPEEDEAAYKAHEDRSGELHDAIREVGGAIIARPVTSLSHIVDAAVMAAWTCEVSHDINYAINTETNDIDGFKETLLAALISMAGLTLEDCVPSLDERLA